MNNRQLQNLISRWFDETIEREEFRTLQLTLSDSVSARCIYRAYASVDAELHRLSGKEDIQTLATGEALATGEVKLGSRGESSGRGFWITPQAFASYAFAAGLLLAIGIWQGSGLWKQELAHDQSEHDQSANGQSVSELSILAIAEPISDACRWYVEPVRRLQSVPYRSGDIIRVTNGKLYLHYANCTTVMLHSPAAYQLISENNSRMLVGRLTATVSEAGKGFSVIAPQVTVVDLGTEFSIEVDNDGATDVVVFQGEVDIDYHDRRASTQRLHMGEAVHFDAEGTTSRIVSITNSTYSGQSLHEPLRSMIITEVRDNISKRASSFNYYEIVRAGMNEDVFAYVDRPVHQYNGTTKEGMPQYLVGGDYVKMFNDDKFSRDIQIHIKLAVPARLYILLDDRLAPPKWLLDDFRNTGDSIGIDRCPSVLVDGRWLLLEETPSGVGPSVSVDDKLSVWVRDIPDPGEVTLGGTEAAQMESNMYGIVAVPWEETR